MEYRQGDLKQRDRQKNEILAYLKETDERIMKREMKDIYVTDHKPVDKKYTTQSEDEDLQYYNYVKSLEEYNAQPMAQRINRYDSGKYEKGSYYQKIFEPMAGGYKLENGTFFVEVTDAYLAD